MANISQQNNIRYNIDTLDSSSYGVIVSDGPLLDCSNASSVKGFEIDSNLPNITNCFVLFYLDSKWVKLDSAGAALEVNTSSPDFETLQSHGNTPAELLSLTNIPAFVGKRIGFAVGLSSNDPANALPKIKFALKCENDSQILQTSQISPVYTFDNAKIVSITPDFKTSGNGNITITAAINGEDNWRDINSISGTDITSIQFKANFSIGNISSENYATLNSIKLIYAVKNSITEGYTTGELISNTENWFMNVHDCRLTLKHSPLENSNIRAFVSMRKAPKLIRGENIGIGSGARKTFQLANTSGVRYDSVKLYFDNVQTFENYEINSQVARITCNAPEGVIVSCDYECDWDAETWRELSLKNRIALNDCDQSEFSLALDDDNLSVCAVKISLETSKGSITRETIGKGTGKTQTYKLSHKVDDGNISIFQNNAALSAKNFRLHDDDTQFISIAANNGATLTASYNWISEAPIIYQFAAVFSE